MRIKNKALHVALALLVTLSSVVAVTAATAVSASAAGTGPALPGENLLGVSCASTLNCVVVGSYMSKNGAFVVTTANAGNTWGGKTVFDNLNALQGISCPSTSSCIAVANQGGLARTTDGGATWSTVSVSTPPQLLAVSCASTMNCVAVGDDLALVTTDGGMVWTEHAIGGIGGPAGISCASTLDCVAVGYTIDFSGVIDITTDGGVTWSSQTAPTALPNSPLLGVSCPSVSHCVATGAANNAGVAAGGVILTTSDGGETWTSQAVPSGLDDMQRVSCASISDCVAVGNANSDGVPLTTADGGTTWTRRPFPTAIVLRDISCASTLNCVADGAYDSDGHGAIVTTTNGGASWSSPTGTSGVTCAGLSGTSTGVVQFKKCTPKSKMNKTSSASGSVLTSGGALTWSPNGRTTDLSVTTSSPSRGACRINHVEEDISGIVTGGTSIYTAIGDSVSIRVCDNIKTSKVTLVPGTTAAL
jgi:photosystem II stability/assembly factor-like uncharacterized protein